MKEKYSDYKTELKALNLESLYDRRERLSLKFAKKCLKNENLKKLFPNKKSNHEMQMRKPEKYLMKHIKTNRYKKSAIPSMIRQLNEEEMKMKKALNKLMPVTREHCLYNSISVKI